MISFGQYKSKQKSQMNTSELCVKTNTLRNNSDGDK